MADSVVESGSSSVSIQAPAVAGHNINPLPALIAAEIIQMDTSNPPPRPPPDEALCPEPEPKRKKIESAVASTSGINEKLELRLGGILCCAVCLDLPKTAMYQVGICFFVYQFFIIFSLHFCIFLVKFLFILFGKLSKTILLSHPNVIFIFEEKINKITNALQISFPQHILSQFYILLCPCMAMPYIITVT